MDIEAIIKVNIQKAISELFDKEIELENINLQETRKEFEGDITLVTFPFTSFSKKNPEETGKAIGEFLKNNLDSVADYNTIKGFLNLVIKDSVWIETFNKIANVDDYGQFPIKNKKVMVEYSSPNTNKPLHLGHVRNNLLGYSISQILSAYGYEVIKANLINDRGIHICKSMLAYKLFGNNETPESVGMKGDHLVGKYYVIFDKEYRKEIAALIEGGIPKEEAEKQAPLILAAQEMLQKWEQKDTETIALWKTMNDWVYKGFEQTYRKLGVDFNKFYYESNTYLLGKEIVQEGLTKGVFFKKDDSSVWVDLTAEGLDQKLILRKDGTSVYMTQDLGTAQLKYDEYKMDQSIYVVGNEQDYHFNVLFLILKKLDKSWAKGLFHLSYGMVDLPSGKMKSREGTVVDADDLIEEMIKTAYEQSMQLGKIEDFTEEEKLKLANKIGLAALKYHLLKVDPKKRLLFDPKESVDLQGHTGPFIQYTYARIKSILRKINVLEKETHFHLITLEKQEKELIQWMKKFPATIENAANGLDPALLANYLYELAKVYNKFYHDISILKEEDPHLKSFRISLSNRTAQIIKDGLNLLGIDVPEKM